MWGFIAKPVIALIFLYEIKEEHREVIKIKEEQDDVEGLLKTENPFFIPQKVSNACGTIALLHAVTNTMDRVGGAKLDSWFARFV